MARRVSSQPTEVELEVLRALWDLGPSPVRAIHQRIAADKGTNYSTTVKMLAVMREKGLVVRDEEATPHIYRPAVSQERTQKRMLEALLETVYGGSSSRLVLHALASKPATPEELDEVQRLLDEMKGGRS